MVEKAIKQMDGCDVGGRKLIVRRGKRGGGNQCTDPVSSFSSVPDPDPESHLKAPNQVLLRKEDFECATIMEKTEDGWPGFPHRILPFVVSSPFNPIHCTSSQELVAAVRELLWQAPDRPPALNTPSRLFLVDRAGPMLCYIAERLGGAPRLGLSLQCGRAGRPAILALSTQFEVFLLDILALGRVELQQCGLGELLASPDTVKVGHDCRQLSSVLHQQFGFSLVNLFDTLGAHLVFSNWALSPSRHTVANKELHWTVRDYLGVTLEHLHRPGHRGSYSGSDWESRPLQPGPALAAARDVLYLLPLQELLERATQLPQERFTQALLAEPYQPRTPQRLPRTVSACLPPWLQHRQQHRHQHNPHFL